MFQNSTSHSLYHFSLQLKTHFFKLEKAFSSSNFSWHRQTHSRLHLHFPSKLMKLTLVWIEKHVSSWFDMKISTCAFVHQIWEFWWKTSFLHMIFIVWHTRLAFQFWHLTCSNFDETWYSSLKHIKIHILSFGSFQTLLILKLSSSDASPTLTLTDDEISKVDKNEFYSSEFESIRCSRFYKARRTHVKKSILVFWARPIATLKP